MFLSKLILNPRSRMVQRELAFPYQMHRTLLRAFPDASDGGPGRVLYRVEADHGTGVTRVLVQSAKEPEWSAVQRIHDDYLASPAECKPLSLTFTFGERLRFRLRANPTYKTNGKRLGHLTEEKQLDWLRRKGETHGFRLGPHQVRVVADGMVRDQSRVEVPPLTLAAATFDGFLEVNDPAALLAALASGIGPGKAFGFGLLSVAPAR